MGKTHKDNAWGERGRDARGNDVNVRAQGAADKSKMQDRVSRGGSKRGSQVARPSGSQSRGGGSRGPRAK